MSTYNNNQKEHIFSEKVKAGRRTYFFDVKQTRGGDYYLVITESRKDQQGEYAYDQDNKPTYKKSKIFLYKEELNNFVHALEKTASHIKEKLLPDYDFEQAESRSVQEK